jgi:hypothetical protein
VALPAARTRDALSVLLLCDESPKHAPNVLEHIHALRQFSRHRVDVFNPVGIGRSRLLRLDDYDAIVIHYSIYVLEESHLSSWFREQLAGFGGLKIQFIQDEYRRVEAMTAQIRELGINVVFSSVPSHTAPDVYGSRLPGVEILPTLTGYVPAVLEGRTRQPLVGRALDVVYRGRSIPYWLGRLGQDKVAIGRGFLARASSTELRCDIAWTEADRIYGDNWYRFLGSSRTTLGTESGASIVDFDGSLQKRTERYLKGNPTATFDEVEDEILMPFEGNALIEAISPRVFEAAALDTAMVNFSGRYSDVIEPWVHYVPLEKDFSNFDDVVALIRDDAELERLASRAHADLVASGRYSLRTFVEGVDHEIETRVGSRAGGLPRSRVRGGLRRKLIAAEQLKSPQRLAQVPVVSSARARARARAGRRLLRRFPEIDALAARAELEEPRSRERLLHDLVRLAAAAAAHARKLRYLGPPFDVRPELDARERRLTLVGTRTPSGVEGDMHELHHRVAAALLTGRLEEIVWDNSAVEGYLTFASVPVSSLEIGYHVVGGAHRFSALEDLAREDPRAVASALAPLFRSRPDEPVDELDRFAATALRALLQPASAATLGAATARAALTSKELRRLLRAYLGNAEARAEAPLELVAKDVFRLWLVGQTRTTLEIDERRRLVYRTNAIATESRDWLEPAAVRSLEQIVWDHSTDDALVTSKERPRVSLKLEGGEYEFEGLTLVARRFPELAAPALRWAAAVSDG